MNKRTDNKGNGNESVTSGRFQSKNIILVDADYVDKTAFNLIVNFERIIGRRIPQADLAKWMEYIALDGGIKPLDHHNGQEETGERRVQVVLIHKNPHMENFLPSSFSELDGQAFQGPLGEFLVSCVHVEELTTMGNLLIESLQIIAQDPEISRIIVIPDSENIYNKVRETLRHADDEKHITVLSMQPMEGGHFRQEILGYSLMAALGIKSDEIKD